MIYRLDTPFEFRYSLRNGLGMLVTGASVFASIKNNQTNEYWNGISWQVSEIILAMTEFGNGLYGYDITFDTVGEYTFNVTESTQSIDETFEVAVSDGAHALVGSTHSISTSILKLGVPTPGLSATVSILRTSDNKFFDGTDWVVGAVKLPMTDVGDGDYSYGFSYDSPQTFTISIEELTTPYSDVYTLTFGESMHVSQIPETNGIYTVSSETIIGTNGDNARITTSDGAPVKGAIIEVHNKDTKEVFRAASDVDGKWTVKVPQGTYIIIVSCDGYISASLEREVI